MPLYDLHLLPVHLCLTVCLQCTAAFVCIVNCNFYTGQQAANLAVLFMARSVDLDIEGLFWSAASEGMLFSTSIANVI